MFSENNQMKSILLSMNKFVRANLKSKVYSSLNHFINFLLINFALRITNVRFYHFIVNQNKHIIVIDLDTILLLLISIYMFDAIFIFITNYIIYCCIKCHYLNNLHNFPICLIYIPIIFPYCIDWVPIYKYYKRKWTIFISNLKTFYFKFCWN